MHDKDNLKFQSFDGCISALVDFLASNFAKTYYASDERTLTECINQSNVDI